MAELRQLVKPHGALQLFTVAFNQCCWSAPYRKPTRLITNLPALRIWGPNTWPVFDSLGRYIGPAKDVCTCRPTVTLARGFEDDTFRTSATSIYPEPMDRAIAEAILAARKSGPSFTKEGEVKRARKEPPSSVAEAPLDKATLCSGGSATSSKATLSSGGDASKATLSNGGDATLSKATLSSGGDATLSNATLSSGGDATLSSGREAVLGDVRAWALPCRRDTKETCVLFTMGRGYAHRGGGRWVEERLLQQSGAVSCPDGA